MATDALGEILVIEVEIFAHRAWAQELARRVAQRWDGNEVAVSIFDRTDRTRLYRPLVYLVGWSEIVPPEFYKDRTVLVLHPGPLPLYRGGSPIQHQIIEGEDVGAVSLFRLDEEHARLIDGGPLAWQQAISLEGTLAAVLHRICEVGIQGVNSTIEAYLAGRLAFREQPADAVGDKLWKRRTPEQSEITAKELKASTARQIHDKVRALNAPYPNAYFVAADGRKVYITETWLEKGE